mmetsp:Transcript_9903/g.24084  ORF Transcript_9903/g.24084 Transcript_9903/m.24084 type:complete len:92 (+) Transcript_9903:257-532(+)
MTSHTHDTTNATHTETPQLSAGALCVCLCRLFCVECRLGVVCGRQVRLGQWATGSVLWLVIDKEVMSLLRQPQPAPAATRPPPRSHVLIAR